MNFMLMVINVVVCGDLIVSTPTTHNNNLKIMQPKVKAIDQEAQSSDSALRQKRGSHSHKHYLHVLKPVNKLKSYHVSHGHQNYHEEPHHIPEKVHHTFSETHEHVHHDHEGNASDDSKKIEEHHEFHKISDHLPHEVPEIQNHEDEQELAYHESHHSVEDHKEKIKVKHHHHHHHHNHIKTVIKKIPEPYKVEKVVHVPVEKVVHVPKPYPVEKIVEKVVHIPVEKIVHVPRPYPVEKIMEKVVHVPVEKIVEKIVHIPKPYPVEKVVEKIVHVPKPYPVIKTVPYPVEVKVPVHIQKPVPYHVEQKIPVPVKFEKAPVSFHSEKPVHAHGLHSYEPHHFEYNEKDYSGAGSQLHHVRAPSNAFHSHPNFTYNYKLAQQPQQPQQQYVSPRTFHQINNNHFSGYNGAITENSQKNNSKSFFNVNNDQNKFFKSNSAELMQEPLLPEESQIIAHIQPIETLPIQFVQLQPVHFQTEPLAFN